jgi:hypothetical protein
MVEKGCSGEYLYFREKTQVAGRHSVAHNTTRKHTRWYRYSSNIFLKFGTRWSWMIKATPLSPYPRERDPVPIVQEARLASEPDWTGAKYLVLPGFEPQTVHLVRSC